MRRRERALSGWHSIQIVDEQTHITLPLGHFAEAILSLTSSEKCLVERRKGKCGAVERDMLQAVPTHKHKLFFVITNFRKEKRVARAYGT